MKKSILICWLLGQSISVFGQGVLYLGYQLGPILTNGLGGSGLTATNSEGFYYGLFVAPSGTTNPAAFTFTENYGTNSFADQPGRWWGAGGVTVTNFMPCNYAAFLVRGWSSNLGHDWATVSAQINSGNFSAPGFYGESAIQAYLLGGPVPGPDPPYDCWTDIFFAGPITLNAVPDPAADLRVSLIQLKSQSAVLQFKSVSGYSYSVESSFDLGSDWEALPCCPIKGSGEDIVVTDTNAVSATRFYRLKVSP